MYTYMPKPKKKISLSVKENIICKKAYPVCRLTTSNHKSITRGYNIAY